MVIFCDNFFLEDGLLWFHIPLLTGDAICIILIYRYIIPSLWFKIEYNAYSKDKIHLPMLRIRIFPTNENDSINSALSFYDALVFFKHTTLYRSYISEQLVEQLKLETRHDPEEPTIQIASIRLKSLINQSNLSNDQLSGPIEMIVCRFSPIPIASQDVILQQVSAQNQLYNLSKFTHPESQQADIIIGQADFLKHFVPTKVEDQKHKTLVNGITSNDTGKYGSILSGKFDGPLFSWMGRDLAFVFVNGIASILSLLIISNVILILLTNYTLMSTISMSCKTFSVLLIYQLVLLTYLILLIMSKWHKMACAGIQSFKIDLNTCEKSPLVDFPNEKPLKFAQILPRAIFNLLYRLLDDYNDSSDDQGNSRNKREEFEKLFWNYYYFNRVVCEKKKMNFKDENLFEHLEAMDSRISSLCRYEPMVRGRIVVDGGWNKSECNNEASRPPISICATILLNPSLSHSFMTLSAVNRLQLPEFNHEHKLTQVNLSIHPLNDSASSTTVTLPISSCLYNSSHHFALPTKQISASILQSYNIALDDFDDHLDGSVDLVIGQDLLNRAFTIDHSVIVPVKLSRFKSAWMQQTKYGWTVAGFERLGVDLSGESD